MAKYLLLWEMNRNLVPIDPKERSTGWGTLLAMVKKDLAKGIMKDWGGISRRKQRLHNCRGLST